MTAIIPETRSAGQGQPLAIHAPLCAAFTEVEITPPREYVTADGERKVRPYDVCDPLKARILVLQQGDVKAAIIGVDAFELGIDVDHKIAAHLGGTGLDERNVLLSPSHIGTTPWSNYGSYIAIFARDFIIDSYEDDCAAKIASGIRDALSKVGPVRVAAGSTRAPEIVYNRRFIKPGGTVQMLFLRPAEIDPSLTEQAKDDEVHIVRFDTLPASSSARWSTSAATRSARRISARISAPTTRATWPTSSSMWQGCRWCSHRALPYHIRAMSEALGKRVGQPDMARPYRKEEPQRGRTVEPAAAAGVAVAVRN